MKAKKRYRHVSVIEDNSAGKIVVKGLKSHPKDKWTYRSVDDDISIIDESDIVTYLPTPKLVKTLYVFPTYIDISEL